jgi:hypothetical protein
MDLGHTQHDSNRIFNHVQKNIYVPKRRYLLTLLFSEYTHTLKDAQGCDPFLHVKARVNDPLRVRELLKTKQKWELLSEWPMKAPGINIALARFWLTHTLVKSGELWDLTCDGIIDGLRARLCMSVSSSAYINSHISAKTCMAIPKT